MGASGSSEHRALFEWEHERLVLNLTSSWEDLASLGPGNPERASALIDICYELQKKVFLMDSIQKSHNYEAWFNHNYGEVGRLPKAIENNIGFQ